MEQVKDIFERLNSDEFTNKLPYATRKEDPEVNEAYHREQMRINGAVRQALEEEFSVVGHPKADLLWYKAWDRGHSSGYYEVALVYHDLVELIK